MQAFRDAVRAVGADVHYGVLQQFGRQAGADVGVGF